MTLEFQPDSEVKTLLALSKAPRFNRWVADTIRPHLGDRILEIGCGIGNLTVALARGAKRYVATDLNPTHLKQAEERVPGAAGFEFHRCDLTSAEDLRPFADSVDTILCINVLEHIDDDCGALANIFATLASGGRAIVLVPEGQSVFGTLDTALGHFRRYSESDLKTKMEAAGFMVEHLIGFNRVSRPSWFVSGRILKQSNLGIRQMRLYDRFVWLWRRIDARLPWRPLSIIAVGIKR